MSFKYFKSAGVLLLLSEFLSGCLGEETPNRDSKPKYVGVSEYTRGYYLDSNAIQSDLAEISGPCSEDSECHLGSMPDECISWTTSYLTGSQSPFEKIKSDVEHALDFLRKVRICMTQPIDPSFQKYSLDSQLAVCLPQRECGIQKNFSANAGYAPDGARLFAMSAILHEGKLSQIVGFKGGDRLVSFFENGVLKFSRKLSQGSYQVILDSIKNQKFSVSYFPRNGALRVPSICIIAGPGMKSFELLEINIYSGDDKYFLSGGIPAGMPCLAFKNHLTSFTPSNFPQLMTDIQNSLNPNDLQIPVDLIEDWNAVINGFLSTE